jgi:hypothetical protein
MLQHQMLTSQMFTFMSGCLGQLFQQSGLQLPQPPTTAELQALLQTGAFAVPQTTTPQAAITSSFLAQLQMTTPTSSQLVSPLTTGGTRLRDTSSHHSAQSTSDFITSELHYTMGRGSGSGGLLLACYHRADLFSARLRPRGSSSRGHSDSNFRHRDDYSSTSSTSSGSGFFLSDLVSSQRGGGRRRRFRLLCVTLESRLYLAAGSFLSASALDSFLVLVAKGGDR